MSQTQTQENTGLSTLRGKDYAKCRNVKQIAELVLSVCEQGRIEDVHFAKLVKDATMNACKTHFGEGYWMPGHIVEEVGKVMDAYFEAKNKKATPSA